MRNVSRRSLIIGTGIAAAAPKIVLADSLLDLPGNALTVAGMQAAASWAQTAFQDMPGCRLVYADGQATGWHYYQHFTRKELYGDGRTYAVAIETRAPGPNGRSYVTTAPIDGLALDRRWQQEAADRLRQFRELYADF